jgi:hypothetical protein
MLLELGADANALLPARGMNIMHLAALLNRTDTLRVALDWKQANPGSMANFPACDWLGMTPLHRVCQLFHQGTDNAQLL